MSEHLDFIWRTESPYALGLALALAALLLRLRPAERLTYRNTLLFFAVGVAGQFVGAAVHAMHFARTAEVLYLLFSVISWIAVLRLAGFAFFRLGMPLVGLHPPRIVEDLVIAAAYAVLAVVHLRMGGVELTGILATSAMVTAVLAFAMQDTLGNVLGGLALQLDNSIRIGDWIRIDDVSGKIMDIRWRSTLIETRNWETVVIPNSVLMKGKVMILGQREGKPVEWRRWIWFVVDPSVPPSRVIAIAEAAVGEADIVHVAADPGPSCLLMGFEQGNLRFALRYWLTDLLRDDSTDSAVRVHLFTALQRVGIRVSEPQQTVHLVEEDEAHAEAVRRRELEKRLQAIRSVDLFATLSEAERRAVAERLQYAPFAPGDVMTRQGNVAHWLYILTAGEAEILVDTGDGSRRPVGKINAGEFFGEMGMMTGAPRSSTVIARADCECYRLDKAAFEDMLRSRPQIAEDVSRLMAARRSGLAHAKAEATSTGTAIPESSGELLERIRRFFGLH